MSTLTVYCNGESENVLAKALKALNARRGRVANFHQGLFPRLYCNGESENVLAKALKALNARRGRVANFHQDVNGYGLPRKHILDAVDASLRRLVVDYIDLYQIHRLDKETHMEEIMEASNDVVRSGKARYIMTTWQFQKMNNLAERRGWAKFFSMQNLLYREEEREMIPYCLGAGIAGIPSSPLAPVIITGKNRTTMRSGTKFQMTNIYPASRQESNDLIVDRVEEIAEKYNSTYPQIALAWYFTKPYSVFPIVGFSKSEQLYNLVGALDIKLTEEDVKALEEFYRYPRSTRFN